jgi:hypothetical protein
MHRKGKDGLAISLAFLSVAQTWTRLFFHGNLFHRGDLKINGLLKILLTQTHFFPACVQKYEFRSRSTWRTTADCGANGADKS